ncbi:hypothetical protein NP233_g10958 [Leucocoprinus birnbaumii]|uniref:Uncharacterized protein n=1 Tax=Leucocoprinus birnbaumii TaxID=56174 RepID=A0AAD5VHS0_9AGAR|nr:hypothetical protein NP233_g10958 [Leucocoprinus birnbaumii]
MTYCAASTLQQARLVFISSIGAVINHKLGLLVPEEALDDMRRAGERGFGQAGLISKECGKGTERSGVLVTAIESDQII